MTVWTSEAEWDRAYGDAMQWRDWQTCEYMLAERDEQDWYTKPEENMGNGERDNALRLRGLGRTGFDDTNKPSSPIDLCVCGTKTRAEHGCLCAPEEETRVFATGASRDTERGKLDYEAFLSPLVLERFAQYMDKHRVQSDGTLRSGDNWQKGIPDDAYMKSLCRHFIDVWKAHRAGGEMEEALCAVLFNTMGLLYELVR